MDVDVVKNMEDIALVEVAAQQVIGIQKTGTYTLIPELLMKIYEYSVKKKMVIDGPPLFLCHENSPEAVMVAKENGTAIVEVAWPVSGNVRGSRDIKVYELPGGKMVHTIHKGPYKSCELTYPKLFAWIETTGAPYIRPNPRGISKRSPCSETRRDYYRDFRTRRMNLFHRVKAKRGIESTLHLFMKIFKRYIRSAR